MHIKNNKKKMIIGECASSDLHGCDFHPFIKLPDFLIAAVSAADAAVPLSTDSTSETAAFVAPALLCLLLGTSFLFASAPASSYI